MTTEEIDSGFSIPTTTTGKESDNNSTRTDATEIAFEDAKYKYILLEKSGQCETCVSRTLPPVTNKSTAKILFSSLIVLFIPRFFAP